MRRLGLGIMCVCLVFLMTGCGEKKLSCTATEGDYTMKLTLKFNSKNYVKNGTMVVSIPYDKDEADDVDDYIDEMKREAKEDGYDIKVSKSKNKVDVTISFNKSQLEDLTDETINEDMKYSEVKASLKDSGFTCKS